MKKGKWCNIAVVVIVALAVAAVVANCRLSQGKMQSGYEASDKEGPATEVFDLVYSNNEGDTVNYYVCITTYSGEKPNDPIRLNTAAISSVIIPEKAESCRECAVGELPAVLYCEEGRAYLCWTVTPELSCVIKYDPAVSSEEDIFRMAESIPANAGRSADS